MYHRASSAICCRPVDDAFWPGRQRLKSSGGFTRPVGFSRMRHWLRGTPGETSLRPAGPFGSTPGGPEDPPEPFGDVLQPASPPAVTAPNTAASTRKRRRVLTSFSICSFIVPPRCDAELGSRCDAELGCVVGQA